MRREKTDSESLNYRQDLLSQFCSVVISDIIVGDRQGEKGGGLLCSLLGV